MSTQFMNIDKMIELQPANGNNYVNKDLLRGHADLPPTSQLNLPLMNLPMTMLKKQSSWVSPKIILMSTDTMPGISLSIEYLSQ